MTAIVAYETRDSYWIGSDSMGVSIDEGTLSTTGSKIIEKENYLIGYAESYRVADIVQETPKFPSNIKSLKDLRKFRDHLFASMQSWGYSEDGSDHPINLIIISPYGIFSIEGEYQIHYITEGYYAIGGGSPSATGSLYVAKALGMDDGEKVVQTVVEACIKHSMYCGGKAFIKSVKKYKKGGFNCL